jgi:protein-L-isoaspartate(D-aspartate) O-methyltransferase
MGQVPRHAFLPSPLAIHAYQNAALPIGFDKTISQPFLIAVMTDLLEPRQDEIVLEVGTGLSIRRPCSVSSFAGCGVPRSSRS